MNKKIVLIVICIIVLISLFFIISRIRKDSNITEIQSTDLKYGFTTDFYDKTYGNLDIIVGVNYSYEIINPKLYNKSFISQEKFENYMNNYIKETIDSYIKENNIEKISSLLQVDSNLILKKINLDEIGKQEGFKIEKINSQYIKVTEESEKIINNINSENAQKRRNNSQN